MGTIATTAADTYRDFVTPGLPSSGANKPPKSDIRTLFTAIDTAVTAIGAGLVASGAAAYTTQAGLFADLAHAAGAVGWVTADTDPTKDGLYIKSGASGSGAWTYSGVTIATLVTLAMLGADVQACITGPGAGPMIQAMPAESGYLYAIMGANNRSPFKIALDGTVSGKIQVPVGAVDFTQLAAGLGAMVATPITAYETGVYFAIVDPLQHMVFSIKADGTVVLPKVALPKGSVDFTQLSTGLGAQIPLAMSAADTGVVYAIVDAVGRAALSIRTDASVVIPKLVLGAGIITQTNLSTALQALLPQSMPPESGYVYAIVDVSGHVAFGIPNAGGPIHAYVTHAQTADNAVGIGGFRENSSYAVQTFTDGSGKIQIRSIRRSDGQVFTLTTTGNNVDPIMTSDNNVMFTTDASGAFVDSYVPVEGGAIYPCAPTGNPIDCWGDSLTNGTGSSGGGANQGPYPLQLSSLLSRTLNNYGVGGQTDTQIIARQGGAPTLLTVTSNQIPTSGAVSVTSYSQDIFFQSGAHVANSQTGTLAGVPGTLAGDVSGNYTFTRTASGSLTSCPANTAFIPDLAVASRPHLQILEIGRNNLSQVSILASLASAIAYMTPRFKRFICCAVLNGTTEGSGTTNHTNILAINSAIASAYPGNYVDLRAPPTSGEMTALGFTPNSTDLTDIANDCIPTGMRATADTLHLNNTGYALWALRLKNFILAKGW